MKKLLVLITSLLLLAACSPPRYTYNYDYYDYNSGKKKAAIEKTLIAQKMMASPDISPLQIDEKAVTASAGNRIAQAEKVKLATADASEFAKKYSTMTRAEKKDFKKELKSEVKKIIKTKKSGESINAITDTKALDHDLKMALIFGIVGIILSVFAGVNPVFWILGVIAGVIAIVFLISWLADQ
jgi:F0F1-type ATP synthase assembly protein I